MLLLWLMLLTTASGVVVSSSASVGVAALVWSEATTGCHAGHHLCHHLCLHFEHLHELCLLLWSHPTHHSICHRGRWVVIVHQHRVVAPAPSSCGHSL
jgi:hypothetical protein